ncbi:MAG: anaerobic ribonucleoside-triphosphate reductase activating protein [Bacteroides sp.]|nr:anaerobic ribonucleoside-triphosphate reductase activating protein [Bacteroides sp.]MBD5374834.1 anaerobic ribonucleoside-triphosphate reductase activating protein [Bacteroides sp.]MDE7460326.1 anaerobic ribonucleoside-triphosphate reductase activating protein [Paramuribaculum sp.]
MITARILDIIEGTTVDGPGFRTSIYFAGCSHACKGCHNPQSWDMAGGREMSIEALAAVVREAEMPVTLSGGDPMYQPEAVEALCRSLREGNEGISIWCYTGFEYEHLATTERYAPLLELIDVLVDGPFVETLRDTSLLFRGSSNQRLIDLRKSTPTHPVLWHTEW